MKKITKISELELGQIIELVEHGTDLGSPLTEELEIAFIDVQKGVVEFEDEDGPWSVRKTSCIWNGELLWEDASENLHTIRG